MRLGEVEWDQRKDGSLMISVDIFESKQDGEFILGRERVQSASLAREGSLHKSGGHENERSSKQF